MSEHEIDLERRFGGLTRLYGAQALPRFQNAHICVIGIGGVGSWVVEAFARSAIGALTLIDLDQISESNINRQVHSLTPTVGQAKVTAMAARIQEINADCKVERIEGFIEPDNLEALIPTGKFNFVVDAIDGVKAKAALIAHCKAREIPLVTIGSAGGQTDPTRVKISDLARTEHEPLLAKVRKLLRGQYHFPRNIKTKFGIAAVSSDEPLTYPDDVNVACEIDASPEEKPSSSQSPATSGVSGLNCAGFGSSVAVTAVFGFVAAAYVMQNLANLANDQAAPRSTN